MTRGWLFAEKLASQFEIGAKGSELVNGSVALLYGGEGLMLLGCQEHGEILDLFISGDVGGDLLTDLVVEVLNFLLQADDFGAELLDITASCFVDGNRGLTLAGWGEEAPGIGGGRLPTDH